MAHFRSCDEEVFREAGAASYDEMASGENYVSNNFISVREFA